MSMCAYFASILYFHVVQKFMHCFNSERRMILVVDNEAASLYEQYAQCVLMSFISPVMNNKLGLHVILGNRKFNLHVHM